MECVRFVCVWLVGKRIGVGLYHSCGTCICVCLDCGRVVSVCVVSLDYLCR